MYQHKPQSYAEYKEFFSALLQQEEIGERAPIAGKIPRSSDEQLAQCIWYEKLLWAEGLKTESGQALQILQSGRWNQEAGADFLQAELLLSGKQLKGDIEVHFAASDWERHEHRKDPRYRKVILHAFMKNDDNKLQEVGYDGSLLERLNMSKFLFPDLETLRHSLSLEDYPYGAGAGKGKCLRLWGEIEQAWLEEFFDLAGRERMLGKVARLADCLVGESLEQVFYQAMMTTMGYKGGKALFFLLAKRTPILELLDYLSEVEAGKEEILLEAIMLNVANLLPPEEEKIKDEETKSYLDELKEMWVRFAPYFTDRIIPATKQWFTGVRPLNFPGRRIAGVSQLLLRFSREKQSPVLNFVQLFKKNSGLSTKAAVLDFLRFLQGQFLVADPENYWSWRCGFSNRRWQKPQNLIGKSRAMSIVFNALLPVLLLYAQQQREPEVESLCWRLFDNFPLLPENVITRFMRHRLFNDQRLAKSLLINECRQQALFQIFYDCCNNNEVSCEDCYFLRRFEYLGEEESGE